MHSQTLHTNLHFPNHQIKGGARKVSVASIEQIGITTSPRLLTANPLDALRKI
jgi:hypothetical protein